MVLIWHGPIRPFVTSFAVIRTPLMKLKWLLDTVDETFLRQAEDLRPIKDRCRRPNSSRTWSMAPVGWRSILLYLRPLGNQMTISLLHKWLVEPALIRLSPIQMFPVLISWLTAASKSFVLVLDLHRSMDLTEASCKTTVIVDNESAISCLIRPTPPPCNDFGPSLFQTLEGGK